MYESHEKLIDCYRSKAQTPNLHPNLFVSVYFLDFLIIYIPLLIRTLEFDLEGCRPFFLSFSQNLQYTTRRWIFLPRM